MLHPITWAGATVASFGAHFYGLLEITRGYVDYGANQETGVVLMFVGGAFLLYGLLSSS